MIEHIAITVSVKEDEWFDVGAWCYKNFDILSGVSFLPHSDHSYQQAPYQECSKETYDKLKEVMPDVNWELFNSYEKEDNTTGTQTLSCTGSSCEIVDL